MGRNECICVREIVSTPHAVSRGPASALPGGPAAAPTSPAKATRGLFVLPRSSAFDTLPFSGSRAQLPSAARITHLGCMCVCVGGGGGGGGGFVQKAETVEEITASQELDVCLSPKSVTWWSSREPQYNCLYMNVEGSCPVESLCEHSFVRTVCLYSIQQHYPACPHWEGVRRRGPGRAQREGRAEWGESRHADEEAGGAGIGAGQQRQGSEAECCSRSGQGNSARASGCDSRRRSGASCRANGFCVSYAQCVRARGRHNVCHVSLSKLLLYPQGSL